MKEFAENYFKVLMMIVSIIVLIVYPAVLTVLEIAFCFLLGTYISYRIVGATFLAAIAITNLIAMFGRRK